MQAPAKDGYRATHTRHSKCAGQWARVFTQNAGTRKEDPKRTGTVPSGAIHQFHPTEDCPGTEHCKGCLLHVVTKG